jgi:hypothetical protein
MNVFFNNFCHYAMTVFEDNLKSNEKVTRDNEIKGPSH